MPEIEVIFINRGGCNKRKLLEGMKCVCSQFYSKGTVAPDYIERKLVLCMQKQQDCFYVTHSCFNEFFFMPRNSVFNCDNIYATLCSLIIVSLPFLVDIQHTIWLTSAE
jgi:hypothetical protein